MIKASLGTLRPWYYRQDIKLCQGGFANPSGHDVTAAALLLSFWLLFNHKFGKKVGKCVTYLLGGIFIVILVLISFHRLVD